MLNVSEFRNLTLEVAYIEFTSVMKAKFLNRGQKRVNHTSQLNLDTKVDWC